jgi:hypothetical protein
MDELPVDGCHIGATLIQVHKDQATEQAHLGDQEAHDAKDAIANAGIGLRVWVLSCDRVC